MTHLTGSTNEVIEAINELRRHPPPGSSRLARSELASSEPAKPQEASTQKLTGLARYRFASAGACGCLLLFAAALNTQSLPSSFELERLLKLQSLLTHKSTEETPPGLLPRRRDDWRTEFSPQRATVVVHATASHVLLVRNLAATLANVSLGEHLLVIAEDRSALSRLRAADLNVIPAVAMNSTRADGDARDPRHLARSRLNHALRLLVSGLTVAMMDADVTVTDSPFAFLEGGERSRCDLHVLHGDSTERSSRLRFGASFIVARPVHRTARVLLDALDELERGEAKTLHEAFNRALRRRWTTLDVCVLDELYFVASAERGSARTARWRVSPILVHHGTADVPSSS